MRAEGSHIVIEKCRVTKCSVDVAGGALLLSNSSLFVANSHFGENCAEGNGGSVAIFRGGRATFVDSTITLSSAHQGGGVHLEESSSLILIRVLLSCNTASTEGGGVHASTLCTVNVTDGIIANNTGLSLTPTTFQSSVT